MKLQEFLIEAALVQTRNYVISNLFENVNEYLSLTMAKFKNKTAEQTSKVGSPEYIDLDHLAIIITGLKILSNTDYRAGIDKRDIGINPNDAKDLFGLFDKIDKNGNDPTEVVNVFKALIKIAPAGYDAQRKELDVFKSGDDSQRNKAIQELQKLLLKVTQIFNKVRTSANSTRGVDIPSLGDF